MTELAIIVPTFNERANVAELVARLEHLLAGLHWEVVFVDDDSPDGTAHAVRTLAQAKPHVRLIERIGRRGLSRAVVEGILSTSAPFIAVMDADLQHDETILRPMWEKLQAEQLDVIVGSRYISGGSVAGWDEQRVRMSQFATRLAKHVVRTELTDPMSGFFVLRRSVFESAVRRLSGRGFKILLDVLASVPTPLRVAEYPYRFRARLEGESKLDSGVMLEFALMLMDKYISQFVPLRFFLFSLVGASGVAVHFAVLWFAFRFLQTEFWTAQTIATLTAMTSNYALNNWLTYHDRQRRGLAWVSGLFSFYAVCGLGVIANVGVASALFLREGWVLAAAAGTLVGVAWNYLASAAVTWRNR
jgi:dolichol-phosphate mannosyltransferase